MNSNSDGKTGFNGRGAALVLLLAVFLGLSGNRGLAGVSTLYDSGFCFPSYSNAALVGQHGWESAEGYSGNAAQVVTCPAGLMVELFGPYVQAGGPNFYNSEFIQPLSNYDPVSEGAPIISVRAEARMNLGPTAGAANWLFGFLVLNDQNGTPYETIGIDKNGVVFGQNSEYRIRDRRLPRTSAAFVFYAVADTANFP